jgi:SMC interacting uncharacterized protein involved in chromosome segregation
MATGIDSHIRDLESEAREALQEVDDFQESVNRRMSELNDQIHQLVLKVQQEKVSLQKQLAHKKQWADKKEDEVRKFKVS